MLRHLLNFLLVIFLLYGEIGGKRVKLIARVVKMDEFMNETGREILLSLGIKNFNEQVLMFDKFLVDVLIPDKNLIIHWDGHYWHSKPRRILLDKSQDAYLEKCGYKVLRITDLEIKNNKERVYDNIKRAIR
jgi:very-short-patch-repair endonuclease